MVILRRGATEHITVTLPEDIDPQDFSSISLDLIQGDYTRRFTNEELQIEDHTLMATLTPEDTSILQTGYRGWIQVVLRAEEGTLVSDKEPFLVLPRIIND